MVGNNSSHIFNLKQQLDAKFSIKDLGSLNYYLGIEVLRNTSSLTLTQMKYALELLDHANLQHCKPATTPLHPNITLSLNSGTLLPDPTIYRTLVGKLLYLTITRPDLSFSAQHLS